MSSLRKWAHLHHEPTEENAKKAAAAAWREKGIVCLNPKWLTSWVDRQQLEILAEKIFGPRPKD